MPTGSGSYPGGSPSITVNALLKQPQRISRDLASLVYQKLVADRLFLTGSPDEAAGGSMIYQEAESIFVDTPGDAEEIAIAADWPRTSWSEALKQAFVKQYGLEIAIDDLAIRRNQISRIVRGTRKIANNLVKLIDTKAIAVLSTNAGVNTANASAHWGTITTDIIGDIATWQATIEGQNNGYDGFQGATLVLNPDKRLALLSNTALKAALPRETNTGQIQTGMVAPFLGLKEILFTPQIASANALLLDTTVAATMADEQPDPIEGWTGYDTPGYKPIWTKIYQEARPKGHVIAAGRWPAMAVTDPKAIVYVSALA